MQYVVTKTTTETFAIEAETPMDASKQAKENTGAPISFDERFSVQPRPQQGQQQLPQRSVSSISSMPANVGISARDLPPGFQLPPGATLPPSLTPPPDVK